MEASKGMSIEESKESEDLSIHEEIQYSKEPATSNVQTNQGRRTLRISVRDIFQNISGIENDGTDQSPPPVVSRFQRLKAQSIDFNKGFEKGDLKYAPSRRNPYYMAIHKDKMSEMLHQERMAEWATETKYEGRPSPDTAIQSFFNVSLKLFHDMATDNVNWLSLSRLIDPQITGPNTSDKEEADTLKEMAFDGLLDDPENDPLLGQDFEEMENHDVSIVVESDPLIWGEDALPLPKASDAMNVVTDATWAREQKKIRLEIENERPRRIYVPIRHQMGWLMWVPMGTWDMTEEGRKIQLKEIKKGFANVWMAATAIDPESAGGYRARYSSANLGFPLVVVPKPETLRRQLKWPTAQVNHLFQGLVDVVNIEKAQQNTRLEAMNKDDVNGDDWVKMGENPFGLFDTYVSLVDFNAYMKSLEVLRGHDDLNLVRKNAHRESKTKPAEITKLNKFFTNNYHPMADTKCKKIYTNEQTEVITEMTNWEIRTKTKGPNQILYLMGEDFESIWRIDVSSDKIINARGKRDPKYAPAMIMGMPANETAQYALGWEPLDKASEYLGYEHRMSSGFFMAEWLHLCAFSWGGLSTRSNKARVYRSSDIPGNLVLGTSETNSVMTRFEKAWQTLVLDSPDLDSKASCPKLMVTRNSSNKMVVRDVKNDFTGNYSRTESEISQAEKGIATAYHFLAYTISYSLNFPMGCKLLNEGPMSSLNTTFYPFLRPLYHKLEDALDKALYVEIKKRYSQEVEQAHSISVNRAPSLDPYNQDSSTVYKGHVPYGVSTVSQQGVLFPPRVDYYTRLDYGINPHNRNDALDEDALDEDALGNEDERITKKRFTN
ncbi:hypothetical protein FGSG_08201 [Fusarium graminearum PH-1]|uniref:Chromosome 2, complete genome n=1 Tax=Gibberella zeae (strain ATCC MYA-4620 / CBS 123657 / FGSC 9075 / NRRL 31084 / PH-1) TaxID=229533 RepID=I1RVD2_GIBZE|nr:hypothetical protein FGSG_08201 [Fusarium graminearum PH-1]ESU15182.1 hypothetical protein FGSG_08201 [Fusarium graminearum PH-1]KAI6753553.1 hypothetical protein HG531_005722 [Fusarium graminearum]CEF76480.1 unnamed protein product [Fusarium graminearum]|eukprot:XP_011320607.1 hypothetical protein FGSG_08201 [Fusarium graminearum PH-1]